MVRTNIISLTTALSAALSASEATVLSLLESARRKEALLRAGDIEGLKEAVEHEEELIASIKQVDELREEKSKALAEALGLPDENPSLRDIIEAMGDSTQAKGLSEQREKLKKSLALLEMHNARVKHLLELKKEYAEYMLGVLRDPDRRSMYLHNGARDDGDDGRRIFDFHV